MTLIKTILPYCLISLCLMSCAQDEAIDWDKGHFLYFSKSPSDTLLARTNCYLAEPEANLNCPDLLISTVAYEALEDFDIKQYYSAADKDIEQKISSYITEATGKEFDGCMPLKVEYRDETCTSITIELYDRNDQLISDVTDLARFHYVYSEYAVEEDVANLLLTSNGQDIRKIAIGSTINEYLSFNPIVFANAHFVFPGLEKSSFENGNYLKVRILLGNGQVLTSVSN